MSFFTDSSEAARYAESRPYFHPLAIERAWETAGMEGSVPVALDIACGTGQSTLSLAAVAERVIGIDISRNMLANARPDERIRYIQARAEAMPFRSDLAHVMTCALAFHWFNRDRFLRQAWRVLCAGGLLLIYNNGFTGIMREEPGFLNWSRGDYPARFPTPPRDSRPFTADDAAASGFSLIAEERYENDVRFTPEALVAYLATQTNVAAAIKEGRTSLESVSQWLLEGIRPFFTGPKATFVFVTRAWTLRKMAVRPGKS